MNKTITLAMTCLLVLGTAALAPTAAADHMPDSIPRENASCVYNVMTGWVCVLSDTGWCWIFHHCPLN